MTTDTTQASDSKKSHTQRFRRKKHLQHAKLAGCFHCLSTYRPDFIDEYVDGDGVALCPRCGIDAVIPVSYATTITNPIHMTILKKLKARHFDG